MASLGRGDRPGLRKAPAAVEALIELTGDPEYLVRYHTLKGLVAVGDDTALQALRALSPENAYEKRLIADAIEAIAARH